MTVLPQGMAAQGCEGAAKVPESLHKEACIPGGEMPSAVSIHFHPTGVTIAATTQRATKPNRRPTCALRYPQPVGG